VKRSLILAAASWRTNSSYHGAAYLGQTLLDHFHLHCLARWSCVVRSKRWSPARKNFCSLFTALSVVFCGKFLDLLKSAFDRNSSLYRSKPLPWLTVEPSSSSSTPCEKNHGSSMQKPFGSPVHVLDYLGRYTHRVALSNDRIVSTCNRDVTFSYRDRKNQNRKKTMTLDAHEFIAASCST